MCYNNIRVCGDIRIGIRGIIITIPIECVCIRIIIPIATQLRNVSLRIRVDIQMNEQTIHLRMFICVGWLLIHDDNHMYPVLKWLLGCVNYQKHKSILAPVMGAVYTYLFGFGCYYGIASIRNIMPRMYKYICFEFR